MSNASSDTSVAATKGERILPVHPLLAVLVVVGIYLVSQLAASAVLAPFIAAGLSNDKTALQFWYVLVVEIFTLGLLYAFLRAKKISVRLLGLRRPRLSDAGATFLAYPVYFVVNAAVLVAATALLQLDTNQKQQTGFEAAISPMQLVMTFISLVILPPLVEEIIMRGFLFGSLRSRLKPVAAALITSVLFAAAHLQFGNGVPLLWLAALDTFILSLVLCYLRLKTGSLWAGIGLHALKNGIAFLVLFVFPKMEIFRNVDWGSIVPALAAWLHWTL